MAVQGCVVSKRLLDRLWEHGYEQPAHKSFLLRFMEQVALTCEVGPDTFLVPSLLPQGDAAGSKSGVPHRHFWLDFAPSFLPDNLFKRLICYAVQKCSSQSEPVLHESFALLTFEGHDFGIEAHLDHDLIKVDIFSACRSRAPVCCLNGHRKKALGLPYSRLHTYAQRKVLLHVSAFDPLPSELNIQDKGLRHVGGQWTTEPEHV